MNEIKEKALILNTSHNDIGLIRALKDMGYYVVAIGAKSGLMGERLVDECRQLDYSDKESVLCLADELGISAICSCCNDLGVLTAAYVAERLGLPGHDPYEVTETLHDKGKFKKFASEFGIKTPQAEVFTDAEKALAYVRNASHFPLMVKASDLSAGNGISKVTSSNEAQRAVENAFAKSRKKHIVVEPFIEGTQHAICTFLLDGKVVAAGSNNEYSYINPYRVEIDTYPARDFELVRDFLIGQIEKMASVLSLVDGIFEMQYILTPEGDAWILECMRRVLGNMYGIPSSNLMGFNWDYWEARCHCGLDCAEFPVGATEKGYYAYRALIAKKDGVFSGLEVSDTVRSYVTEEVMLKELGEKIINHGSDPIGFLFFSFPSREVMDYVMIDGYDEVRIQVL